MTKTIKTTRLEKGAYEIACGGRFFFVHHNPHTYNWIVEGRNREGLTHEEYLATDEWVQTHCEETHSTLKACKAAILKAFDHAEEMAKPTPKQWVDMTMSETTRKTIIRRIQELFDWVRTHEGEVDRLSFQDGCNAIQHSVSRIVKMRAPLGLPVGLPRVDYALILMREYGDIAAELSALAYDFPRLPGASHINQINQAS